MGTSTTAERQFVWGLRYIDDLILRDRSTANNGTMNERRYGMQDGNWNMIAVCDTTGSVTERYAYSAYGAPVFMTGAGTAQTGSASDFETLYAGYRWDGESPQIYYVRNRFLLPVIGTWNRRDPLGYLREMNLLTYGNSPVTSTDAIGLFQVPKAKSQVRVCIWDHGDRGDGRGGASNQPPFWKILLKEATYPYYHPELEPSGSDGGSKTSDGRDMHKTVHHLRCNRNFECYSFREDYCNRFDSVGSNRCIKDLVLHDHGADGRVTCGDGWIDDKSFAPICDRLCENAVVYLMSCSAGQKNSKESTAELILRLCPKVKGVYACQGFTYGFRCDGKIVYWYKTLSGKIDRGPVSAPRDVDFRKVLPNDFDPECRPHGGNICDDEICNG